MMNDLIDILEHDWPAAKDGLESALYGDHDPLLMFRIQESRRRAPHRPGHFEWSNLSDEDCERLLFCLVSETPGYENPQWLQPTHAADRGRDISVTRVDIDPLGGVRCYRTIIQCKH